MNKGGDISDENVICEIVTSDGVLVFDNVDALKKTLKKLDFVKNVPLRLDLHDVLDTTEPDEMLSKSRICGISYVGRRSKLRIDAQNEFKDRISKNQILFGVLVFKRGKDKHTPFMDVGSKAWFNILLDNSCDPLFIDDSLDHVVSVNSVGVHSIQMFQQDILQDLIQKYHSK